jgi:hypothetical protein
MSAGDRPRGQFVIRHTPQSPRITLEDMIRSLVPVERIGAGGKPLRGRPRTPKQREDFIALVALTVEALADHAERRAATPRAAYRMRIAAAFRRSAVLQRRDKGRRALHGWLRDTPANALKDLQRIAANLRRCTFERNQPDRTPAAMAVPAIGGGAENLAAYLVWWTIQARRGVVWRWPSIRRVRD